MMNQQFRKDYWVKGARRLSVLERTEIFRALKVILLSPRGGISLKIRAGIGEASMQASIYNPILDALADYTPKTLGQIELAVKDKGVGFGQITQSIGQNLFGIF